MQFASNSLPHLHQLSEGFYASGEVSNVGESLFSEEFSSLIATCAWLAVHDDLPAPVA